MQVLYGTGNPAKLDAMRKRLQCFDVEIIGLSDIKKPIPVIEEDGMTPLENAKKKARGYWEALGIPVFSCDSGLYFDNVPTDVQPGVHVRTVNGKYLTDDEMIAYYIGLAKKYGTLKARYRNAICFIQDETHVYEAMNPNMESEMFYIVQEPHAIRKKGFPLDSLSVDVRTGKHYFDLDEGRLNQVAVEDGFLEFFKKIWK